MKIIDNIAHRLMIRVSTIPNAGVGLFTGIDIPAGVPVCEYKGDVFSKNPERVPLGDDAGDPVRFPKELLNKRYNFTLVGGYTERDFPYVLTHPLNGESIDAHPALSESTIGLGGFANDTRAIEGRTKEEYKTGEDGLISKPFEEQVKDGYNLHYWPVPNKTLLYLISIRDIAMGEELFVDYGWNYWQGTKRRAEQKEASDKEFQKALEKTRK